MILNPGLSPSIDYKQIICIIDLYLALTSTIIWRFIIIHERATFNSSTFSLRQLIETSSYSSFYKFLKS